MKKILLFTILGLVVVVLALPLFQTSLQSRFDEPIETRSAVLEGAAERLAQALTYKTISQDPRMVDSAAFEGLFLHLQSSFPTLWSTLDIDTLGSYTLFMSLPGTSPQATNQLFISHLDVVPVDQKSISSWDHPPFSGTIANGQIYGRGALDDKSSALGTLEALESLLTSGWRPSNNLYFCMGSDEEIGGSNGAAVVAKHCASLGLHFEHALDEGGIISLGNIPGLESTPVALVGTAEKGYLSVEVNFNIAGGHSSIPNAETSITQAADFVHSLSEEPLFPGEFPEPLNGFTDHLVPHMPYGLRILFAARPLTTPLVLGAYQKSNTGRALTGNTAVATIISSGIKDNVIPVNARVVCNTRTLPGTSLDDVLAAYIERAAQFGGTVEKYGVSRSEASATSSPDAPGFIALGRCIRSTYPEALISPYLTIGGTDSKNFEGLVDHTYRFLPMVLNKDEVGAIHGTNEKISVEGYNQAVYFYIRTLQEFGEI